LLFESLQMLWRFQIYPINQDLNHPYPTHIKPHTILPGECIPTSYKSMALNTFHLVYLLRLFVAFWKSKVCTWKLRSHVFRNCVCMCVRISRIGGEKFAGVWKIDAVAEVFGFLNWQLRFLCVSAGATWGSWVGN